MSIIVKLCRNPAQFYSNYSQGQRIEKTDFRRKWRMNNPGTKDLQNNKIKTE